VIDNASTVFWLLSFLPLALITPTFLNVTTGFTGELYICVGSNTNGGIPGELSRSLIMKDNFFSSAILVANLGKPNFNGVITYNAPIDGDPITGYGPNGVEIFAPGLRNPYGIVMHSNGELYATDNGKSLERSRSALFARYSGLCWFVHHTHIQRCLLSAISLQAPTRATVTWRRDADRVNKFPTGTKRTS
jgi:hypothetical protein